MSVATKQGSLGSYLFGFIASVILTLIAYILVAKHLLSGWTLILTLVGLAIIQAIVQLILFLYLGKESKPRLNLLAFLFMLLVLITVIGGSLWIMYSLNERVMPQMEMGREIPREMQKLEFCKPSAVDFNQALAVSERRVLHYEAYQ